MAKKRKKTKPEKINISLPIEQREGQIGINRQGLEMKITRYSKLEGQKTYTMDIEFLIDGYKVYNREYSKFLIGMINNPNFRSPNFIDRTGERRKNNQGYWMEVIKYFSKDNCIVRFDDDGSIVEGVSWHWFDKGSVEHPIKFSESLLYLYPKIAESIANEKNNITLDDCSKIKPGSNKPYFVKCPECGKISSKRKFVYDLTYDGISCEYCSDGISIPNKMLRQIDEQLDLNWQFEYSPEWLKLGNKQYKFDAYDDELKIVIEADANCRSNHKGERKKIDDWKDKVANEHGIKVIRIDLMDEDKYRKDTLGYIKQQLYKSLNNIYDLNKINWELAWLNCQNSLMIEACRLWQEEYVYSTVEIGKILKLTSVTIVRYLKRGNKLGICDYTPEKSHKERGKRKSGINGVSSVLYWVIKSNGELYSSIPLCVTEIYNLNGKGFLNITKMTFDKYIKPYNNIDISRIQGNYKATIQTREKLTPYDGWQFIPLTKEEKEKYLNSIDII